MKCYQGMLVLISLCMAGQASSESYDVLYGKWKAKQYDAILPELLLLRQESGGRNWRVDYMIGTSACHASTPKAGGRNFLRNVLVYKDLTAETRAIVQAEIRYCDQHTGQGGSADPSFGQVPITTQVADQPAGVYGKGDYLVEIDRDVKTTDRIAVSPVSRESLQSRLVGVGQEQLAASSAAARLGEGSRGIATPGLAVVCGRQCAPELQYSVARCLSEYRDVLRREFDMQPPTRPVTVYIPDIGPPIRKTSLQLHGVDLPPGTIAYSVTDDLSIVGPASIEGCGSLAHELVHLSIRGNFGDSPAWLEEGLASEVAISRISNATLKLSWSWRDAALVSQMQLRPTVSQLLSMNWSEFTPTKAASLQRVSAVNGMGAAFVRYLDSQRKLRDVYFAIRDKRLGEGGADYKTDAAIVEEQLGKSASAIDAEFVTWFKSEAAKAKLKCTGTGPAQGC